MKHLGAAVHLPSALHRNAPPPSWLASQLTVAVALKVVAVAVIRPLATVVPGEPHSTAAQLGKAPSRPCWP